MVKMRVSNKREAQREQEKWESKIIDNWKERWYQDLQLRNQQYTHVDEDCFAEWLYMNMEFLKRGKTASKRKNFFWKFISLVIFVLAYLGVICWNMRNAYVNVLTPIISLIPSYVLVQWIRVRKYQETWSRYSLCYTLILQEMVRYIYHLQPYDNCQNYITCFMENILALVTANMNKFYDNMVNKEYEPFSFSKIEDKLQ